MKKRKKDPLIVGLTVFILLLVLCLVGTIIMSFLTI